MDHEPTEVGTGLRNFLPSRRAFASILFNVVDLQLLRAMLGLKTMAQNGESNDPFHLQRFVDAQATCFAEVRAELLSGQKRTHWMWFIFPQLSGLGSSPVAQRFAISGPDEANAYLLHPTLGERLRDCTALVNETQGRSIEEIFGYPDYLKFHSSVTLFAWTVEHGPRLQLLGSHVFAEALRKYFNGIPDEASIKMLHV